MPILHDRVPSIVPTLRAAAELRAFTQNINKLSLAFVTPLRPCEELAVPQSEPLRILYSHLTRWSPYRRRRCKSLFAMIAR